MKKWIGIAAILICCGVYAMVKISISQYQDANPQAKETPNAQQADLDNTDEVTSERDSDSRDTAAQTDGATAEGDLGTPATAEQVEAITKVFNEFVSAVKSEDYEQAWKLTSESIRSEISLERFEEEMADKGASMAEFTLRPGSATVIGGRVSFVITHPSGREDHVSFIQEDGQWKFAP